MSKVETVEEELAAELENRGYPEMSKYLRAGKDLPPPQSHVVGEDHITNLIESADAISMLIGEVGNYGGKLEYRRKKLRELADLLRTPSPSTRETGE